jgi:hypothetical protein
VCLDRERSGNPVTNPNLNQPIHHSYPTTTEETGAVRREIESRRGICRVAALKNLKTDLYTIRNPQTGPI